MNQKRIEQIITLIALLFISASCLAGELSPLNNGLKTITATLTGTTGITIATIAVCGTGLACLFGRIDWQYLIYVVVGVAILFGSGSIVNIIKLAVR